jgi:hypothetical protein
MIENKEMQEAIDRIARSADGLLLYRLLQKVLCGTVAAQNDVGALQINEGRRTLARDLMAFMAEGIAENDRACVTFAVAKPIAGAITGTDARRKWLATQSWYDAPDHGQAGSAGNAGTGSNGTGSGAGG